MDAEILILSPLIWVVALQFFLYAIGWWLSSFVLPEERQATRQWGLFMLLVGAGLVLSALRREPRTLLPYVGSSICFITSYIMLSRGLESFFRISPANWMHAIIWLLTVLALLLVGVEADHASFRTIITFGMGSVLLGLVVLRAFRVVVAEIGLRLGVIVAFPALLLVVMFSIRVVQQLLDLEHPLEMHLFNDTNRNMLFGYMVGAAMFNFSFLTLVVTRLLRHLRDQATRDVLTGLPNRRAFDDALQREWLRFQRTGQRFAILVLDLDYFKRINDTHGHLIGDMVLQEMGRRLAPIVQLPSMVARTGGEEFMVLIPYATAEQALSDAEQLRCAIVNQPFVLPNLFLPVTMSVGVSICSQIDSDVRQVLHRADLALYRAKLEGRNRVVWLAPPNTPNTTGEYSPPQIAPSD